VVTGVSTGSPPGVLVIPAGPRQQPFLRPAPRTLDPHLVQDFSAALNLMQDVSPFGDTLFADVSDQYVASIPQGFVEGEGGLVYDAASNVYHLPFFFHNRTNPALPLPASSAADAAAACTRRHRRLATVIQRYGHMYYHWLEETLPRIVALLAAGALTPDTRLLTWGQPYEAAWLRALGVDPNSVVVYDPEAVHCADALLVPTPVPRVTPPREALAAVRSALGVAVLPPARRDVIVYVSRRDEPTRRVANEAELLAALRAAFPGHPIEVFTGGVSPAEAIALFQRARVVVGPHGAGLSHILFSAPGTAVVEFLFLADPPMMFWHAAGALGQDYWLVPVPQGYYMQPEMVVPVGEVVDVLTAVLGPAAVAGACAPGTAGRPGGPCVPCPPGSYAYNAGTGACKLCPPGQAAGAEGSAFCSTCKPGTYSNVDGAACDVCPAGSFSVLPGAGDASHCLAPEGRRRRLEEQALNVEMLSKLSPVFAKQMKRRALIQGSEGAAIAAMSQQELCKVAAAAGSMGDPYRGPYLLSGTDALCQPTTGTGMMPVLPDPHGALPDPVALPPIDVGVPPAEPDPVTPPAPTAPPPTDGGDDADSSLRGEPLPEPVQQKKVLDAWAIALIATASALIVIPLLFCCGRWCVVRRRRSKAARSATAAAAAAAAPPPELADAQPKGGAKGKAARKVSKGKRPAGEAYSTSNPAFDLNASTTSGSGGGSGRGARAP